MKYSFNEKASERVLFSCQNYYRKKGTRKVRSIITMENQGTK